MFCFKDLLLRWDPLDFSVVGKSQEFGFRSAISMVGDDLQALEAIYFFCDAGKRRIMLFIGVNTVYKNASEPYSCPDTVDGF